MPQQTSKFDLLIKINNFAEKGSIQDAILLQNSFIESIKKDKQEGRFNSKVNLDNVAQKIFMKK